MDTRAFPDENRRREFWSRLEELINEFPEIMAGFDKVNEGEMDADGILYDSDVPKFYQGLALLVATRNLTNWEALVVLNPPDQSVYMTQGMIAEAAH